MTMTREEYCTRGYKYKFSHMPLILKKRKRKPPTTTTITSICHKKNHLYMQSKKYNQIWLQQQYLFLPQIAISLWHLHCFDSFFFKKKVSLDTVRQSSIKIHSVNKSPSFNVHTKNILFRLFISRHLLVQIEE